MKTTITVWQPVRGVLDLVEVQRPEHPPHGCKMINEDLECTECGQKANCIKPGHCYLVEGRDALKY